MPSGQGDYVNIAEGKSETHERTPWYWRSIALAASWMILGGYLILPGLYARNPDLKISQAVLSVFVVALLTAGYSFTALLCFACHNDEFQAESVFLPALASSVFGLATLLYNFLVSRSYEWGRAAVSATVTSGAGTILYAALLFWKRRRIARVRKGATQRSNLYSEQSYYENYIPNMYPSAVRTASQPPLAPVNEDDPVNQQMALLMLRDARPSPDANSSTFRIDLPEDREELERFERSQELVGTPQQSHNAVWTRDRANSRPDSLSESQAWQQWHGRGRTQHRPSSSDLRSNHSRGLSREERRREIELGRL
ncbi:uncharacterized protein EKO05_0007037 [Ascochyta rabiei]|uniref:Uncharacterized protein n=1 Tax=Didymella rabiei TaxID=5454 RepID=A0A162Z0B6_DIDRA|nr:uncharacterized protein EKO05_0007037 [Ascochyta rabiei]KZM20329.1 hypothetical protein ST47_g8401 [Ascochyta rabiei]UPX16647.1 hypothetical protein EKO05_0007037 [Ascochyta rabiei]